MGTIGPVEDFDGLGVAVGVGEALGAAVAFANSAGVNSTPLGDTTYQTPPTP